MTEREQAFVARYEFPPPRVVTETEKFYAVDGDKRFYLGRDENGAEFAAHLRALGGTVESRRVRDETFADLDPAWLERAHAVREELRSLAGGDEGAVATLDAYNGVLTIHTPTRLGQREHQKRRRVAEAWLRAEKLEWTLHCATQHSDAACRPLAEVSA